MEVAYDDLAKQPVETIREIYSRLGIGGFEERMRARVEATFATPTVKGHKVNKFDELPAQLRESVAARWEAYTKAWGYDFGAK